MRNGPILLLVLLVLPCTGCGDSKTVAPVAPTGSATPSTPPSQPVRGGPTNPIVPQPQPAHPFLGTYNLIETCTHSPLPPGYEVIQLTDSEVRWIFTFPTQTTLHCVYTYSGRFARFEGPKRIVFDHIHSEAEPRDCASGAVDPSPRQENHLDIRPVRGSDTYELEINGSCRHGRKE